MIRALFLGIMAAALLHLVVLLFGGVFKFLLVRKGEAPVEEVQKVDIVAENKEEDEPDKREVEKVAKIEDTPEDQLPDTTVLEEIQQQQPAALSTSSLSDLESALSGIGGGSDFGGGGGFASGGVIGGTGRAGGPGDIDQILGGGGDGGKPRVISSPKPKLPPALRNRGGSVTLVLWVGDDGRVGKVEVEKSTESALEKPVIEALLRWTFSPATRGGVKVPAKIRQTVQFESGSA